MSKISQPWNLGQRSITVTESRTIRYTGYGFLLVFYSNLVPKSRYSTSKMKWPWKPGQRSVKVIGNVTIQYSAYGSLLTSYSNYDISCRFWDIQCRKISRHWNTVQRSLKVIEGGIIWQIAFGFILVFYSNFVSKMHHFWDIQLVSIPWNPE